MIDVRSRPGRVYFRGKPVSELIDEQMSDVAQEDIAVESHPVPGLVVVHAQIVFEFLEALLDGPAQQCRSADLLPGGLRRRIGQGIFEGTVFQLTDIEPNVLAGQPVSDFDNRDDLVLGENRAFGTNTQCNILKRDGCLRGEVFDRERFCGRYRLAGTSAFARIIRNGGVRPG